MTDSLAAIALRDFVPVPMVRLAVSEVVRAVVPAVDVHNHLGKWHGGQWEVADVPGLVGLMDECNVATIVNLDGGWGSELEENFDRYDRAFPGRFVSFCRLDWDEATRSGWSERLAGSIRDSASRGAVGVKLWKDIGLRRLDEGGRVFFLDDPRLEPVWAAIEETGMRVLVHTADPAAFFQPLDARNERLEELLDQPTWHFPSPEFATMERLLDALETVVAGHPNIVFIGAHVGCNAEDLDWVDRMLTSYPNFYVDIAARMPELGRQPRRTKRLFEKHPTRALLGTDVFPPTAEDYRRYFRFLQTDDEYFAYSDENPPESGRWQISGLDLEPAVLAGVLGDNARRLLPGLSA
jgi:predicted TIM-barrel fold metal-dependent hydrolase